MPVLKIAIFDYRVIPTDLAGGCHLRMLRALCHQHEFTVFAVEFDNPCPERIRWVRVPAPTRPQVLLFLVYHLLAPVFYRLYRLRCRARFDLVQSSELAVTSVDVTHSHFCNRAYLKRRWRESRPQGARRALRWLDHWFRARIEPRAFRSARSIVVPSRGLLRELSEEYPSAAGKAIVIPNPVDIADLRQPERFDRKEFRRQLGSGPQDLLLSFVALGHFERKGLPLLLSALSLLNDPRLRLMVVGGTDDLTSKYRARAERSGLGAQVVFTRMQRDVRPYLWSADAFVFPSYYETFSIVTFEAAAAGLPIVVSRLHGVEEFLRDGENGILVERTAEGVARGISGLLALAPEKRQELGRRARLAVQRYSVESYVAAWQEFYRRLNVA